MIQNLKKGLLQECIRIASEKVDLGRKLIAEAQEAANDEEKSSAGDKYETGRAMMHLEQEKAATQFDEALKLKIALEKINPSKSSVTIEGGSIVVTDNGLFFLSVALGQIRYENQDYYAISPVSPLGKELLGKRAGEIVAINGRTFAIKEVQ